MIRHLYWFPKRKFRRLKKELIRTGTRVVPARLTPCQVMSCEPGVVYYAPHAVWSRVCRRQGSWYRASHRCGDIMVMSSDRLAEHHDRFRTKELAASDFVPESLPGESELVELTRAPAYEEGKPEGWEAITWRDSWFFKILFTLKRVWGKGEGLPEHWVAHRANHANFLEKSFVTEWDGEEVAHSVTESKRICSSCVEFFGVSGDDSRKLVRPCPGSVMLAGLESDVFMDVKPVDQAKRAED